MQRFLRVFFFFDFDVLFGFSGFARVFLLFLCSDLLVLLGEKLRFLNFVVFLIGF